MHARTVIAVKRLWHKRRRFAVHHGRIFDDIFEKHQVIGRVKQVRVLEIDLALAGGRDFVVMAFDVDADIAEDRGNRVSKVNRVNPSGLPARNLPSAVYDSPEFGYVSVTRTAGIPMPFFRIDSDNRPSSGHCETRLSSKTKNSASGPTFIVSAIPVNRK